MKNLTASIPRVGNRVACRVIYQNPIATRALATPFRASDGTEVRASPSGMPYVAVENGRLIVALRRPGAEPVGCGVEYGGAATAFPDSPTAAAMAARAATALREFKSHLRTVGRECLAGAPG